MSHSQSATLCRHFVIQISVYSLVVLSIMFNNTLLQFRNKTKINMFARVRRGMCWSHLECSVERNSVEACNIALNGDEWGCSSLFPITPTRRGKLYWSEQDMLSSLMWSFYIISSSGILSKVIGVCGWMAEIEPNFFFFFYLNDEKVTVYVVIVSLLGWFYNNFCTFWYCVSWERS